MKKEYEQPDWNKFKQGIKSTLFEAMCFGLCALFFLSLFAVILKTLF